ncbi:MAG TPA: hypothetical protein PLD55_02140 [bacterium]|nr:hypothetical protein [bacterium]HQB09673.1 hypothetical protein [bacterium]HQM83457.1 hypothetical protein [bacterium]
MKRAEISEILFKKISEFIKSDPENVKRVEKMVETTAFFPGGKGLWLEEDQENIFPDILVLGQDFSHVKYYEEVARGEKKDFKEATFRNMIKLFKDDTGINLNRCFFSNVFMGLRVSDSMTGNFPGKKSKTYVEESIKFLLFQIETIKPKVIITLGKNPADILSKLDSKELEIFKNGEVLKTKDEGLKLNVDINGHKCNVVALEHPSMRHLNIKRRKYKNLEGNDAEVAMIMDAI